MLPSSAWPWPGWQHFLSSWAGTPYPSHGGDTPGPGLGFFLFLIFGAIVGLIVMVVGLALVGILALIRQRNKPSYIGLVLQIVGVTLLVFGYNASQSGRERMVEETMAYLIGGITALVGGAALAHWGGEHATT